MTQSVTPAYKYRAFISYSHADSRWARWLQKSLETYKLSGIPAEQTAVSVAGKRPLAPVFRDRADFSSAASLSEAVRIALKDSESLVVICSPEAVRSSWVNEEILTFKRLGRSERIFCFIVDGEPHAGDATECFPEALRYELDASGELGTTPFEPLAADARAQGDGRATARLKLIAGLLGLGFDELRQRDLSRRHRRMLAVTTGSLLISVLTISLAIMAYFSNAEAERRRAQAEDLIGFMLGDLQQGLQEARRLDIFTSVGNKAMDYFTALSGEQVGDKTLSLRAKALRQIGEVRLDQGESGLALDSFRESLDISAKLAERNPLNADWQIALANSHFYVGLVHWQRDETDLALQQFETVLPIVDSLSERDPDSTKWLVERGYAYTNLGRVLEQQGKLDQALGIYLQVKKTNDRLVELEPDNVEYVLEVGFAHNNIGKILETLGRLQEAGSHYRKDLDIKLRVVEQHSDHNLWRRYLATSHSYMGKIFAYQGNYSTSREHYSATLAIQNALLIIEPDNTDEMESKAIVLRRLATLDRQQGDLASAKVNIQASLDLYSSILEKDQSNSMWQRGQADSELEASRLAGLKGDYDAAKKLIQVAQESLKRLITKEPDNQNTRTLMSTSSLLAGDILFASAQVEAARMEWQRALDFVEAGATGSQGWQWLDLKAALLARLGRNEEAGPLNAQLDAMGLKSGFEWRPDQS